MQRFVIRERSINIPINQKLSKTTKGEYSLNLFDPSKSSPPNDFMIKLHRRINTYHMDNKDNRCDIE